MKYVHTLDVCFNVKSDSDDWYDLTPEAKIAALQLRLSKLINNPQEIADAFGHVDTYEA